MCLEGISPPNVMQVLDSMGLGVCTGPMNNWSFAQWCIKQRCFTDAKLHELALKHRDIQNFLLMNGWKEGKHDAYVDNLY